MTKLAFEETYMPDTTVFIERSLAKLVEEGVIRGKLLIHRELVRYFEELARNGSAVGILGLQELVKVRELAELGLTMIEIVGEESNRVLDQQYIDRIVRDYALKRGAKLITHNEVQAMVCKALGVDVLFIKPRLRNVLTFEKYFDDKTMSIHLKEGAKPRAKKGRPGAWVLVDIEDRVLTREELELMIEEIVEYAKAGKGSIEVERPSTMIVQLGDYRIIITKPPVSNGIEITITKPLVKLKLEDYNLPEKLIRRLDERAEGILIAGAPGMGKTTFAQALAEYYSRKGKIVKTIESPRDMRLIPEISQYSKSYATSEELHDLLLLSRPDYTVFDEMRDDNDFKLYVDLRLAGIGMIGVVHATTPIDAIQRFLGRVDLGMIPSIIDTVIFIENGHVTKVYDVSLTVRLPTGLREAELARPVVEVRDFLTNELEYEIYTFGEETIVVPVKKIKRSSIEARISEAIRKIIPFAEVEVEGELAVIKIPRMYYSSSLARKLKRIEKKLSREGIGVEIKLI